MRILNDLQWMAVADVVRPKGQGRRVDDYRARINGLLWIAQYDGDWGWQNGWGSIPNEYGGPKCREQLRYWRKNGTWKRVFEMMATSSVFTKPALPPLAETVFDIGDYGADVQHKSNPWERDQAQQQRHNRRVIPILRALRYYVGD
jgi:transposase